MGRADTNLQRRGFSLIELLVSIGIVLILLGLLTPTLSRARSSASQLAQLKSIQQGADLIAMFTEGNRGNYPLHGDNQFAATSRWYEPLLIAGLLDAPGQLDPKSAAMGLRVPFAMSASMCSDANYYTPDSPPYPDESERPVAPVRTDQVVFPSSKGLLLTHRVGYPVDGYHAPWCCLDLSLKAPVAFADGSAESLAVNDFPMNPPMRLQEIAGVPVYTTWFGIRARDR